MEPVTIDLYGEIIVPEIDFFFMKVSVYAHRREIVVVFNMN